MSTLTIDNQFKEAIKSALPEVLAENPELLKSIVEETIEDIRMARAIREGLDTPSVSEDEVLRILGGSS